jgi:hypothetical protein
MTTPQASFGISRRILLSSLALLPALIGPLRSNNAHPDRSNVILVPVEGKMIEIVSRSK